MEGNKGRETEGAYKMKDKELFAALEQIKYEKGISEKEMIELITSSVISALKKHHGKASEYEVEFNTENATIKAYAKKIVRDTIENPKRDILISEAKKYFPDANIGDEIKIPVDTEEIARISAQTAKQVIIQKIRENEREKLFNELKKKEQTVITSEVFRIKDENVFFLLDNSVEAILPPREQIKNEKYSIGRIFKLYVVKVEKRDKGHRVVLSRTHPELVRHLFCWVVPELKDGVIEIKDVAREPGIRCKLSILSHNPKVDPIGACVGVKGSRVQAVKDSLNGERMDLILYSDNPVEYIKNALSPAEINEVKLDEERKEAFVTVNEDQLSLAIGKNGLNVKLAAKLTSWHIDIKSFKEREMEQKLVEFLKTIDESISEKIRDKGLRGKLFELDEVGFGELIDEKYVKKVVDKIEEIKKEYGKN